MDTPERPADRRVGLLGGTFDPPHLGHLVVAEEARDALGLDEVRLLVAGDPWMKDGESPAAVRVALCEAAVAHLPGVVVDDREARRTGPTYTADTLAELAAAEPGTAFTFLLGADAANDLPRWERAEEALALARFVVVARAGDTPAVQALGHALARLDVPRVDVSSTDVRRRVAEGRSIRHLVPPSVRHEIEERRLYRSGHA
ncbi:MAG: nicotinate-nucleotide adenylyltransferase [Actinomycetes bacterium]